MTASTLNILENGAIEYGKQALQQHHRHQLSLAEIAQLTT